MWFIVFLFLSSCSYWGAPVRKVQKALKAKDCETALSFFQELVSQSQKLKVARKASAICLRPSPKTSLWFYDYLSKWEQTQKKRLFFKKKAGDLAFEKVQDYEQALFAYSFLKEQATLESDKNFYSFRIAFSYFKRHKWASALRALKPVLEKNKPIKVSKTLQKKSLFLRARIFLMQKDFHSAIKTFHKIRVLDPQYFKEQEMFLYLAFIYEEQKDFHSALAELEAVSLEELSSCPIDLNQTDKWKKDAASGGFSSYNKDLKYKISNQTSIKTECLKKIDSIKEKIKKLKLRQKNQPGAGLSQAL